MRWFRVRPYALRSLAFHLHLHPSPLLASRWWGRFCIWRGFDYGLTELGSAKIKRLASIANR